MTYHTNNYILRHNSKLSRIVLILSFFTSSLLSAQTDQIRFEQFTVEDGLSQNWIKNIFQDSYGYLWFGTGGNGINKYNAYEFLVYKNNSRDKSSLSNNWITGIYEDRDRNLWISAQRGINLYDREKDNFVRFPELDGVYCLGFYESDEGKLYVLALRNIYELNREDKTVIPFCETSEGCLTDIFVNALEEDIYGNLWLGSTNGLYQVDLEQKKLSVLFHDENDPESISDNELECLYRDNSGRIWIGTVNKGLSLLTFRNNDPGKPRFINYMPGSADPKSITGGRVRSLLDDGSGQLWIGKENGGLDILDFKSISDKTPVFSHFRNNEFDENSISGNSIYAIAKDDQGTIWIGTYGNGVNYYNRLLFEFRHYKYIPGSPNSLVNNLVNVIYKEGSTLWIGTEGGISVLDMNTGQIRSITHDPDNKRSLSSNAVWAIYRDSRKNLWIGTWDGGLNLYNPTTGDFTRIMHDSRDPLSLGGNNIFGITEDWEGDLWIACMNGGLNRYDYRTNTFRRYIFDFQSDNSISGDWVRTILVSSLNEIWISTSDAIDLLDKKTEHFVHFTNDPNDSTSISYNGAFVIFEDSKKNIWFGTEGGLNCFIRKDSSFIYYTEEDGLPDNSIKGICEDDHGNLWLSSNKGITKFYNGINKPANPVFKNLTVLDGLQGDEFNRRSAFRDEKGYLYFGGIHGLNIFHPDSLRENSFKPPVVITNFSLFNRPADYRSEDSPLKKHISYLGDDEIILTYDQTVLSFEFAALNFIVPDNNRYRYFMDGFDKDWNEVGNKREATYTNLNPGNYKFIVQGSNNDGVWNEDGITVNITILPPWWKTTLFRFIMVLVIIGLLLSLYYYRLNQLIRQKKTLGEMVRVRTLEIEEKNRILQKQAEELGEINTRLEERQQQIEEQAEKLREQADEMRNSNLALTRLNATKDKFFSIIAHDLKNPFASILGFCEILLLRYDSYDDKKRRYLIEVIERSARNIYKLLENLLQWARSQTGGIRYTPEVLQLDELVMTVQALVDDSLTEKRLTLVNNIPSDYKIFADRNMINTVIRNLLTNAIKFSENGEIRIEVKDINGYSRINIIDQGVGIRQELKDKIFDVDRSKSTEGTRGETGTGLGLIICKEFIEKHGGMIGVESETGRGSTFFFTIPRRKS